MGYIRVYRGNDLTNQFELGEEQVTIGRTEGNTLVLLGEGVSRQHAAIEFENGEYYIVDLGSQNGVFLNNEKVVKSKLKYWDEVQIHNFVIKFMAKQGLSAKKDANTQTGQESESDKTKFFKITDEKQLDDLRKKTKECFINCTDEAGVVKKILIKKPKIAIGKSKDADLRVSGWFAPGICATIERHGNSFELVPRKRGKVSYQNRPVLGPTKLLDGSVFSVRGREFKFFNRLTKTS